MFVSVYRGCSICSVIGIMAKSKERTTTDTVNPQLVSSIYRLLDIAKSKTILILI
jgi:hypothetical protein